MTPEQIERLIRELMETGEILATKAFELAFRQVYVLAIQSIGWAIFFGLMIWISILTIRKAKWLEKNKYWSDWEILRVVGYAGLIASPAALLIALSSAISYLMNPEWYAMKLLVDTFLP